MDQKAISELSKTSFRAKVCEAPLYFHTLFSPLSASGINRSNSSSGRDGVFWLFGALLRGNWYRFGREIGLKRGFGGLWKDRFALNSAPSSMYLMVILFSSFAFVFSTATLLKPLLPAFPSSILYPIPSVMDAGPTFATSTFSQSCLRSGRKSSNGPVLKRNSSQFQVQRLQKSPKSLRTKLHGTNSMHCSPLKAPQGALFPPWLLNRKDFQDLSALYSDLGSVDVWEVCTRPDFLRNRLERKAVMAWLLDSPFLAGIREYQLSEVCKRLQAVQFPAGAVVMEKGAAADCMYVLVEGEVGLSVGNTRLIERIYPKNVIGELGMQSKTARSATIVAITPVKTLKLTSEDYDLTVSKLKSQQSKELSLFLRSTSFFSLWEKGKIERLSAFLMLKTYKKGQLIYKPGEFPQAMFIVRSGLVQITALTTLKRENQWPKCPKSKEISRVVKVYKRTLRLCREGDVFGEGELLDSVERTCSAVCTEPCLLYLLAKDSVEDIFTERERLRLKGQNDFRPETREIRSQLEAEHFQSFNFRNALLDGIAANPLPSSRSLACRALRKQHLAKLFIQRHRSCERQELLCQLKDVEVVERQSGGCVGKL